MPSPLQDECHGQVVGVSRIAKSLGDEGVLLRCGIERQQHAAVHVARRSLIQLGLDALLLLLGLALVPRATVAALLFGEVDCTFSLLFPWIRQENTCTMAMRS